MARTLAKIKAESDFQQRLREANERHARGDIDPELAARLTKPKQADALHQVFVDIKGEDGSRPVSPRFVGAVGEESCRQILQAINAQICLGKLKGWGNARIETAIHTPAN